MVNIVDNWPSANLHNLNLDWVLDEVKKLGVKVEQYGEFMPHVSAWNNGEWDVDHAYTVNEIVTNGNDIYMAKQNVPAEININNTDYWMLVATIDDMSNKVDKNGDTMTGELTVPRLHVKLAVNPTVEYDTPSEIVGATYVRTSDNAIVAREFKQGQTVFHEDYALPTPTADSSNPAYNIITTKGLIPWQSAGSDWLTATANAKMDIVVCFSFAVGNSQIRLDVHMPIDELDETFRFHFSQTAYVSGTTYHAQVRAKINGLDYTGVYDGDGTQITEGVTTTIYYR